MIAVLFGTLAAALYGSADFLGGLATRRAPMLCVTAISQGVGLICLLAVLPFFAGHPTRHEVLWNVAGGICGGLGIALLYHALSIGKMGVVSPITAVLAAIFPVTVGIVRGESLRWYQLVGIALALVAVVMISISKQESGEREIVTAGVKEAIAAGVVIGVFFVTLGLGRRGAGLDLLLAARLGSIAFLLLLAAVTRTSLRPSGGTLPMIVVSGAIDMGANVLFVLAAQTGALAVAAVLTSLYPASTVLLARIVLRERLQTIQKTGVVLALAGVALIAA